MKPTCYTTPDGLRGKSLDLDTVSKFSDEKSPYKQHGWLMLAQLPAKSMFVSRRCTLAVYGLYSDLLALRGCSCNASITYVI